MWSERHVLDSLLWEAAVDDLGIYPRAVIKGDIETLRTDWQDGWNAAVMAITEKHGLFTAWVEALTEEQSTQLRTLLDSDGEPASIHVRDNAVTLSMSFSDTFAYACADGESFTLDELPEIHRLWKAHGYNGLVAWAARKRHAEPVKEVRLTATYLAAKADLS